MKLWKRNFRLWGLISKEKKAEMFHRPLIPVLLFFIGGILCGQFRLFSIEYSTPFFLLLIITTLITLLFIPLRLKAPIFMILFLFVGIFFMIPQNESKLLSLVQDGEKAILEGTVLQPPKVYQNMERFELRAEQLFIRGGIKNLRENLQVSVYNPVKEFIPGERIRFPGKIRSFKNFNNPGRYNYELAMKLKGLSCNISVSDGRRIVTMGNDGLNPVMSILEKTRKPIKKLFKENLSPDSYALYSALILGERQGIKPVLRESFNRTGMGHILAVSGLHIGLIAWLIFYISKVLFSISYRLTLKTDIHKLAAIVTCIPVIGYTILSGFHISSQRAMIMVLTYLFSIIIGREKEIWSTLALAALIVLALDPNQLFSISFQLSFLAVVGILWISPIALKKIPDPLYTTNSKNILSSIYIYFFGLIVITLCAVIFLLPITAFYFHQISLVSIPTNLMVIPILGFWIIPFGLLSSIFVHFSPWIAGILISVGSLGLELIIHLIKFWADFTWSSFWIVTPNIFEIVLCYVFLLFLYFFKRGLWVKIGFAIILIIGFIDISFWVYETRFNKTLRVTYFDVGQGNSALIQFPGKEKMLIDGGGFSGSDFDVGRMIIAPSLWYLKIRNIDYIVLTHPQVDHMGGLQFIASNFSPKEFWYNGDISNNPSFKRLLQTLKENRTLILLPENLNTAIDVSGANIDVLYPHSKRNNTDFGSKRLNNNSLVLRLSYKGISFLFPGDLEIEGERAVVRTSGDNLKSDILLAPHHGSKSSCSRYFLEKVKPKICVISSGRNNYFGFPHRQTIERLKKYQCKIIRIDQVGAVRVVVGQDLFDISRHIT